MLLKIIKMKIYFYLLCSFVVVQFSQSQQPGYAMYVWEKGWDSFIPGCDENAFLEWNESNEKCLTHTWNDTDKIFWLLGTCSKPGREITTLYLYGLQKMLTEMTCDTQSTQYVKQFIHFCKVIIQGLKIYGLLSDGGETVPEKNWVRYFVWYNENCAAEANQKIDGIAISNNDYDILWSEEKTAKYITSLYDVILEANKQFPVGSLKTHYSVGWVWGKYDNGSVKYVTWNGKRKYVMEHFIDMFDTIDVQVAFITADTMIQRLQTAGLNYSREVGKPVMANIYSNKAIPCQTTFFPFNTSDSSCPQWSHDYKTEEMMFQELDLVQSLNPGIRIVLHHFRGAYSSGGNKGWPAHHGTELLKNIFNSVLSSNPNYFSLFLPYLAEQQRSKGFQVHERSIGYFLMHIAITGAFWMMIYM